MSIKDKIVETSIEELTELKKVRLGLLLIKLRTGWVKGGFANGRVYSRDSPLDRHFEILNSQIEGIFFLKD